MQTEIRNSRRRRVVVDHRELARTIGARIRAARLRAGLTQPELAGDRYTKAYISALELGHAKPSMAALDYLAPRLGTTPDRILAEPKDRWTRLDADLRLASGRFAEAAQAYADLLETATDRAARAELGLGLGEASCRLGLPTEAAGPLADAERSFDALGRVADRDRARYWLAYVHHMLDDVDEARRLLRGLLEPGSDMEDADFEVRVRIALAQVESAQRNHERALAYLEEARAAVDRLDLPRRATWLDSLARARQAAGDDEGAVRAGLEALVLFRTIEATNLQANAENELALTFARMGSLVQAATYAEAARTHAAASSDTAMLACALDTLASIALAAGDASEAIRLADEVLSDEHGGATDSTRMSAHVTRARALGALARTDEAVAAWEAAAAIAAASPSPARRREVFGAWADALASEGRHAEAYELMRRAIDD